MNLTFEDFKEQKLAEGCQEVLERVWEPNSVVETHTHNFTADALVVKGSFQLTVNGHTRNLVPGSTFYIPVGVEHSEVYGPEGATWWVGRS
jgi:quercetin dioxygenase-like cupin family protein